MFTRVNGRSPQAAPAARQPSSGGAPSFLPLRIQTKLVVGGVDDPLERQAEQVAERVVSRSPGPLGISSLGSAAVQRCDEVNDDCSACEVKRNREDDDAADPDEPARKKKKAADVVDMDAEDAAKGQEPPQKRRRPGDDDDVEMAQREAISAAPPTGTVTAGVETSIRQAQSGGEPLAAPVRERMEQSFGVDFGRVRLHADSGADHLNRSLSARAFTTGPHIFFRNGENRADSPAGERLLAHELTHVVQQGGAEPGPRGVAPRFLTPAVGRAAGRRLAQRAVFAGPQFAGGAKDNTAYAGHDFNNGGAMANTGCGIQNSIRTAGEKKNQGASDAGTPTNFDRYKNGGDVDFLRNSGLLSDPSTKKSCAVTKMHLINHRLENTNNTQDNAANILLGTRISNNPRHLHDVENHVINALGYSSRKNAAYQTAMAKAKATKNGANEDVLFWKQGEEPAAGVLSEATDDVFLLDGDVAKGVAGAAANLAKDVEGVSLVVDAGTPARNRRHLWLDYKVTANYGAYPPYVQDNIDRERNHNNALKAPVKETEDRIVEFTNTWASNAFPPDFDCDVSYYSATYEPGNIYLKETEHHNMRTDLK